LVNNLACFVIRDIRNYANTHMSCRWQGSAATTAAAFTKERLEYMLLQEVQAVATIVEVVNDGENLLAQTYSPVPTNSKPVHKAVIRVDKDVSDMRHNDDAARGGVSICPY
jgi:hypothetical protein